MALDIIIYNAMLPHPYTLISLKPQVKPNTIEHTSNREGLEEPVTISLEQRAKLHQRIHRKAHQVGRTFNENSFTILPSLFLFIC